ncbi:Glycosyltransferase involved in cell wall bisynthesis [Salipaludibacillus aurantiacus]|uniref:Glycosyltransferase involved in cell wall bisynthesis n=2 Tax=Salipaludibacillus aurantiacus TaxID=1601833 RepID=A0A1H9UKB2_9BACI|nr:Glycosyltransferase involved in cell wall bisynthesis [Salipaludibacillus aurantiacus]
MKKKSIIFVIDSLDCAGAEKSLVTLLSLLDYSTYSVDLMLFSHGNILEELVPEDVKILKPLEYTKFTHLNFKKAIKYSIKKRDLKMLYSRLKYSVQLRKKQYNNRQKSRLFWESVSSVIEANPKKYDIAISYAQGVPTFYVAEKIKAKRKLAWVNVSYRLEEKEKQFQKDYYDKFDSIVAVSESTKKVFLETFPEYANVIKVVYDINNPAFIRKMADIGIGFQDNFNGLKILTIGRLAPQKGYDIALAACEKLIEAGIHFRWYALGKGPLQEEIENKIKERGLSDHFILLGVEANPYPFIKGADIYVQTSKFEGFGLAIAEARMLNVPVVTTEFDAVYNQMVQRKNGLVVDMNAEAVGNGIIELIQNKQLKEEIISYLRNEKKGNTEELAKFYELVNYNESVS